MWQEAKPHTHLSFYIFSKLQMYEIIKNETGIFVKVRSEFTGSEGNEVKLTRYFQFERDANLPALETWLSLQHPDFLRKNIEETLVAKGKCQPVNPNELADEI